MNDAVQPFPARSRPAVLSGMADRLEAVRPSRLFGALYLLALAAGLLFGLLSRYRPGPAQLEFDEAEYWALSSQLLDGSFVPFPRRTAAFPLILAGFRLVTSSFLGVQMLVTALFAFSAPLLFLLVRRLSGSAAAGVVAGLVGALWPPILFYGATLYSEPAALPFFLLALYLMPVGGRVTGGPTPIRGWAALGAGLVLALATQIRTMYLLFVPFVLLFALMEARRWRLGAKRALLFLAGFALVTSPWSAYMSTRFGHLILVTSNGGETLSGGLGPRLLTLGEADRTRTADRSTWLGPGKWVSIGDSGYLSPAEIRTLPYDRQDALLRARTLAWVKAHPLDALRLQACKLAYMWGAYRMTDNGMAQLLFGSVPILLLLLMTFVALARRPALWRQMPRLWLVPLFVSGVALISWGSWRFRQPADVALIALAVIGWWPRRQAAPGALSER